jgi:hypothetical protein
MTTAPSTQSQPTGNTALLPPEEQFWKRYSPHGEAPLSWAGSFTVHALMGGALLLFGVYLASVLFPPSRTLPIEPVRVLPGGGGPRAVGDARANGTGSEDTGPTRNEDALLPGQEDNAPKRPALSKVEADKVTEKFDPASVRLIQDTDTGRAYARLQDAVRDRLKLNDGRAPSKGRGGLGKDGGKGPGSGTGVGPGTGTGKAKVSLSIREKRMLRWHMRFLARNGPEYLAQLRGLGAILAIPVREGPKPEYKIVRDLRPGAQLLDEDISTIQRIYWIDDKPSSVRDIIDALNLKSKLEHMPRRFVAFMPEKLEESLYKMEKRYAENVLGLRPFNEDRIDETNFRVVGTASGYRPELLSVTLRGR